LLNPVTKRGREGGNVRDRERLRVRRRVSPPKATHAVRIAVPDPVWAAERGKGRRETLDHG
jgi:hypothetical protein